MLYPARVVIFMLFDKRSCESWEEVFISYHGSLSDVHHKVSLPMKIEEMGSGRDMYCARLIHCLAIF